MSSAQIEKLLKENQALKLEVSQKNDRITTLERDNLTAYVIGDAIMDGICEVDKNGIIININKGFTKITEITPGEIIGRHVEDLVKEGYFTCAVSPDIIRDKTKKTTMSTITRNNKNVLLVGSPILDENNEIVKVITMLRDLTALINLKERLQRVEHENREIVNELDSLRQQEEWQYFIGKSLKVKEVKEMIKYVAPTDATVFLVGDTGSGKEVVAREIFEKSERKNGPYVKINCAAIPENLLESELFGYVKGAFTGADNKNKKGLFETANGGTLLLDEISEMPLSLQPKLLRVLQEREVVPLGGTKSHKIDTRIIASCNKDPKELVKKGLFRADLYYRLNVFPIHMPSLKERRDDVPDIAVSFVEKFNGRHNKEKSLGSSALFALMNYDWPGNVRELENVIERMVVISNNSILTKEDVQTVLHISDHEELAQPLLEIGKVSLKDAVKDLEAKMIQRALDEGGSSYAAAKLLKTTQPTVIRKAQALGIKTSRK